MSGAILPAVRPAVLPAVLPAADARLAGTGGGLPQFPLGEIFAVNGTSTDIEMPVNPDPENPVSPIHPSWLYFRNGFAGYTHWLGFMPYRNPVTAVNENPCVCASHDGITWVVPEDGANPISPTPPEGGNNADINLCYDPTTRRLIALWFRSGFTEGGVSQSHIRYRTTADGVTWDPDVAEAAATMKTNITATDGAAASPSLLRHGGKWLLWTTAAISGDPELCLVRKWSATNLEGPWTLDGICTWSHPVVPFHIEMRAVADGFVTLIHSEADYGIGTLMVFKSPDGLAWTTDPKNYHPILTGYGEGEAATPPTLESGYYKSSLLHVEGVWKMMTAIKTWTKNPKVVDLSLPPLADGYFAGKLATAEIRDDFSTHGDGSLKNKVLPSGQTWVLSAASAGATNEPLVDAGVVKANSAVTFGIIAAGAGFDNGRVGIRFSKLAFASPAPFISLIFRSNYSSVNPATRFELLLSGQRWFLRSYAGSFLIHAQHRAQPINDPKSWDGIELVVEFNGTRIRGWWNNQPQFDVVSELATDKTDIGFYISHTDTAARISGFWAEKIT